ncbi:unnamed protein product [Rotaria magnacalcarata]|uniref:Uncharacterized protein n=4 Tax=Rotaria magnacalcarata TaxID=392030 RepID=A0A8S2R7S3_9BILA|nr:unnamed protein product [Rotaria magnacalcarata]
MDGLATSSYKLPTGLRHAQSMDNVSWVSNSRKTHWPPIDEHCQLHGAQGKCTCASFVSEDDHGVDNEGMGSSESFNQSTHFGQPNNEKNDDFVSASVKPFNNNSTLPDTKRDVVGNNVRFNRSLNNSSWVDHENDQLAALLLYRDALKKNLTTPTKAGSSFPRMRHGRIGSQWRHIKQTNTYSGSNLMFIDGTVRVDDSIKFPIPRFGYPPMKQPQHQFSASHNDLSFASSNPTTKSLDTLTWSRNDGLNRNQYLARYSNRLQQAGKDKFAYWPSDSTNKKSACQTNNTRTYKTWFRSSHTVRKLSTKLLQMNLYAMNKIQ